MKHFEIRGWHLPTLTECIKKALALLGAISGEQDGFSMEAHCKDLVTLKYLADVAVPTCCACYCWRDLVGEEQLRGELFSLMRRAYIVFDEIILTLNADSEDIPERDWNGEPPAFSIVTLKTLHRPPLASDAKSPSSKVIELLSTIGGRVVGSTFQSIATTTAWIDQGREHSYFMKVPRERSSEILSYICHQFDLTNGRGSFEFLGTPDEIDLIRQSDTFHFDGFPADCWNLNYPADTVLSFGTSVFMYPVQNIKSHQLLPAASLIDRLEGAVGYRMLLKRYLSWKLPGERLSPRLRGNYLVVSRLKTGYYAIFLGFDRSEDSDPPYRQFIKFSAPIIEEMGAELANVPGPKGS